MLDEVDTVVLVLFSTRDTPPIDIPNKIYSSIMIEFIFQNFVGTVRRYYRFYVRNLLNAAINTRSGKTILLD